MTPSAARRGHRPAATGAEPGALLAVGLAAILLGVLLTWLGGLAAGSLRLGARLGILLQAGIVALAAPLLTLARTERRWPIVSLAEASGAGWWRLATLAGRDALVQVSVFALGCGLCLVVTAASTGGVAIGALVVSQAVVLFAALAFALVALAVSARLRDPLVAAAAVFVLLAPLLAAPLAVGPVVA